MSTISRSQRLALPLALVAALLLLVPAAFAAKGGGKPGGGGGGGTGGSSSLSLVMVADANGNGLPDYDDQVTFTVSTSSTPYPSVQTDCRQNGTLVYTHSAGFYPSYPWQWAQTFTLQSTLWTGGAASCTAKLYYMSSKGSSVTIGSISFTAGA